MTDESSKVRELTAEVERLRATVERQADELAKANRFRARVAGFATGSAVRVLLSGPLVDSLKAWLRARKTLRDPLPVDETAEVMAAIVRRVVRVGLVGLAVAALPMVVLVWQGFMMRAQNAHMREQSETMREQNSQIQRQVLQQARQFERQEENTYNVRRAQLLDTIYDCEIEEPAAGSEDEAPNVEQEAPGSKPVCRPKAHIRARREAVLAFVKIEQDREVRAELPGADLTGANLRDARLSRANLRGAKLSDAELTEANLRDANLRDANLRDANLSGADLTDAYLTEANLRDASLYRADLAGANLVGASLAEAFLRDANLRGANLAEADLTGANLAEADLTGADLTDATLNPTFVLGGANLHRANFHRANLHRANLHRANLYRAKNLTQDQINKARGNTETKLPDGLKRPDHWK